MKWSRMKTSRSVIRLLQNAYRSAIRALYPDRCPVCGRIAKASAELCDECRYKVKYITSPFCMVCGKPLEDEQAQLCYDCEKIRHEYVRGVSAFAYTDEIKESLYRFKYSNRREYAAFYAETLCRLKGNIIWSFKPDVIIPIPLHAKRLKSRGFNQAYVLSREIGRRLGIPVDDKLLVRSRNTAPQKALDDKERTKNLKNAFQLKYNIVQYNKVLLVDDIYTTGATIDACAALLKAAGVKEVYFASVCVGRGF